MVLASQKQDIQHQKQHRQEKKTLELLVIFREDGRFHLHPAKILHILVQFLLRRTAVVYINVVSVAGIGYLATHILVQAGNDSIAFVVYNVLSRTRYGYWSASWLSDTKHIDMYSLLCCGLGSLHCPTLVIFTVCYHEDGTRNSLLRRKAVGGQ